MISLDYYDTIILDCDGVIFDSNNLKLDAFRKALDSYDGKKVDQFIEYFRENFGVSRYVLAEKFIADYLHMDFDDGVYSHILKKYSDNCILLYNECSFTKNFFDFINYYENKNLFVASGSDEEELRKVFTNRNIMQYFTEVYGSPARKTEIIKKIIDDYEKPVMVGDSISDKKAAEENDIDFIFMNGYSTNGNIKKDYSLTCIEDLSDLL